MSEDVKELHIVESFGRQHRRDITLRVGETYVVKPLNKQKLKHRGRVCTLLGFSKPFGMEGKPDLIAEVQFSDNNRRGRVEPGDLAELSEMEQA